MLEGRKNLDLRGVGTGGLENRELHGWLGLVGCMYAGLFFFPSFFLGIEPRI